MTQENATSVTDQVLSTFLTRHQAVEAQSNSTSTMWDEVEELAREVLRSTKVPLTRPTGVSQLVWVKAKDTMMNAAHAIMGEKSTYVLGFLTIIVDVLDGSVEKVRSSWNTDALTMGIQKRFENENVKVHPLWVTAEQLEHADPVEIQLLLRQLVVGDDTDPAWHEPQALQCEDVCVRRFFMPVVFTVNGPLNEGWTYDEVYDAPPAEDEDEIFINQSFLDMLTLDGESDTRFNVMDIGPAHMVLEESATDRDMREVETRLTQLYAAVTQRENPSHEARLEIQLTWGALAKSELSPYDTPSIRFAAYAKNMDEPLTSRFVIGIHTNPAEPQDWPSILAELLAYAYKVGWPIVQIKQFSGAEALQEWGNTQDVSYMM